MISIEGHINLPASKSISNRVLIIQNLCATKFEIENLSTANDTILLNQILDSIKNTQEIQEINVEDAGTPYRFLTAFLSIQSEKSFLLKGNNRMKERPIGDLVDSLHQLSADIFYSEKEGFPPILIHGKKLDGGKIFMNGDVSSQFFSALCLIAPTLKNGLTIHFENNIVSKSYLNMTLKIMQDFGIIFSQTQNKITIPSQKYIAKKYIVENDWSSVCFFYAMSMIADEATISFTGLFQNSVQGDSYISELAKQFGIETIHNTIIKKKNSCYRFPTRLNLTNYPDLAIPIIVAIAIEYPTTIITGIHHLAYKESNRIEALKTELEKVGIFLTYENDILSFKNDMKSKSNSTIFMNSYNDHRIVMALNLLSLKGYNIEFDNIDCVKKSFPSYWTEMKKLIITS